MSVCPKCGRKIITESNKCVYCGEDSGVCNGVEPLVNANAESGLLSIEEEILQQSIDSNFSTEKPNFKSILTKWKESCNGLNVALKVLQYIQGVVWGCTIIVVAILFFKGFNNSTQIESVFRALFILIISMPIDGFITTIAEILDIKRVKSLRAWIIEKGYDSNKLAKEAIKECTVSQFALSKNEFYVFSNWFKMPAYYIAEACYLNESSLAATEYKKRRIILAVLKRCGEIFGAILGIIILSKIMENYYASSLHSIDTYCIVAVIFIFVLKTTPDVVKNIFLKNVQKEKQAWAKQLLSEKQAEERNKKEELKQ